MKLKFKGFLASSSDDTGQTLSLTVESFSKVVIGIVGWYAVSKGLDPATATTQVQGIIDLTAQAIPVAFTLWHSMQGIWGLVRKVYQNFFTVPVSQDAIQAQPAV